MIEAPAAIMTKKAAAAAAPSFGPAVVTVLGADIPILALGLSLAGLLLARKIAPPPSRKLTRGQEVALTFLLSIVLFVIVTGQFTGEPLGVGMSVVWSIGLGLSGLLVIELFGSWVVDRLNILLGRNHKGDAP